MTIRTEFKIPDEIIFSIFSIYGQIESFQNTSGENFTSFTCGYYDLRSAKKAYSEISFNFVKLMEYKTDKYQISYEKSKKELFEKFYIVIMS
jgi:hypothetical protein